MRVSQPMKLTLYVNRYVPELSEATEDRVEKAVDAIRDEARRILVRQATTKRITYEWREHGVYKKSKRGDAGKAWTARHYGDMAKTVRTVKKNEIIGQKYGSNMLQIRNIRLYAGNYEIWWAKQMEYGRGGWVGGRRSFLRPAIRKSAQRVREICRNGA